MAAIKRLAWSDTAEDGLATILAYYRKRNGSPLYGKRLSKAIVRRLRWVRQGVTEGEKTATEGVRQIRQDKVIVLYEEDATTVRVIDIFDARRDVSF